VVKRNSKRRVTSVTATGLPVLYKSLEGKQDGFGVVDGSGFRPLRVISREHVLSVLAETPSGKVPRSLSEDEWRVVQAAHSLQNALDAHGDKLELEHAFTLLNINYPKASRGGASEELWEVVALGKLAKILSAARLVFWFDDRTNQLSPGIYCPDFKTAVIVSSLFGDTFHICPKCRKVFFAKKTYCSLSCQGAHRQARYRAAKKTSKRKAVKNVALQTR
jgi:uncharacterized C2H2 Zn-finger protein